MSSKQRQPVHAPPRRYRLDCAAAGPQAGPGVHGPRGGADGDTWGLANAVGRKPAPLTCLCRMLLKWVTAQAQVLPKRMRVIHEVTPSFGSLQTVKSIFLHAVDLRPGLMLNFHNWQVTPGTN